MPAAVEGFRAVMAEISFVGADSRTGIKAFIMYFNFDYDLYNIIKMSYNSHAGGVRYCLRLWSKVFLEF